MVQHDAPLRAQFVSILLASTIFQHALETVSEIAQQVQGHAIPNLIPDPHMYQFGQQWAFSSTADNMFIRSDVTMIREHLAYAMDAELPEFTDYRFMGLSASTLAAVGFTAAMGPGITRWRATTLQTISKIATDLLPLTKLLLETFAPSHIRCHHKPNTHVAFIELITRALHLSDSELAFDLCVGMPAIGTIPSTGNWRQIEPEGREIFTREENDAWNLFLYNDMSQTAPSPAESDAAYKSSIEDEIDAGTCDGYFTYEEIDLMFGKGNWRSIRAFPVLQKGKYRRCDDAKESLHNAASILRETITTIMADWPVRAAAAFAAAIGFDGEPWQMMASTDDMYKAYRMAPCSQPQYTITAVRSPNGDVRYLVMAGFNFGLKAAVPMFNRIPFFSTETMRRLLGGVCDHYFDDIATAEPSWAAAPCPPSPLFPDGENSVQACLWCVHTIIGFPLAFAKKKRLASIVTFLGVISDFTRWWSHGEAKIYTSDERKRVIAEIVQRALNDEKISRNECESLTGKLGFLLLWSAGKFGRAVLRPLYDYTTKQTSSRWSAALKYAFLFVISIIMKLPRSTFRFKAQPRPTVKVWTDACWEPEAEEPAGLGIVLFFPQYTDNNGKFHESYYTHAYGVASKEIIEKFKARKQYIGQLELYAALLAYTTFKAELQGRKVIHWIDNTSALASLIKGYSGLPDSAQIIHAFHAHNMGLKCRVWFEYVNTKANIADEPSRGEFTLLNELKSKERDIVHPELAAFDDDAGLWMQAASSALTGSRSRAAPQGEEPERSRRRRR